MVGLAAITGPSRSQTRLHHAIASYKLDRRPGDNTILRMAGLEEACLQVSADNYCRTKPGHSSPTPKPRRVDRRPASAAEIAVKVAARSGIRLTPDQRPRKEPSPIGVFQITGARVASHTNQSRVVWKYSAMFGVCSWCQHPYLHWMGQQQHEHTSSLRIDPACLVRISTS